MAMSLTKMRVIRQQRGLSIADLARSVKMNPSLLSAIDRGDLRGFPQQRTLIAEALGVREEDIFLPSGHAVEMEPLAPKKVGGK